MAEIITTDGLDPSALEGLGILVGDSKEGTTGSGGETGTEPNGDTSGGDPEETE